MNDAAEAWGAAAEGWQRYLEATRRLSEPLPREHGKAGGIVKRRTRRSMGFTWHEYTFEDDET